MHVLITGGTGFIGRELCKQLYHAGHTATVLTRSRARAPRGLTGVRLIERLDEAQGVDTVVNLAGENLSAGRWTPARKKAFRDSRIGTTERLQVWIEAQAVKPRVLISGSAIGYYGASDDTPLTESAAPGAGFAAELCRDWEAAAARIVGLGVRVCVIRIGLVLGHYGGALPKMLPPFRFGLGGPMGTGEQWMSWIRRGDLVRMIQWLLENPKCHGTYNAVAPEPIRNREFAMALGRALNRPARLKLPAPLLKTLMGEMSSLLLTGQRVLPARVRAEGFTFQYPHLDQALRDLLR